MTSGEGGAILLRSGTLTIDQSTITGNSAPQGGGVVATTRDLNSKTIRFAGSIVSGNTNDDVAQGNNTTLESLGHNLIGTSNAIGVFTADTTNLVGVDPLLGPLAGNGGPTQTHALLPGSRAIDAGEPDAMAGVDDTPEFDQRGAPFVRVNDGDGNGMATIDIGAFEAPTFGQLKGDMDLDGDVDFDDIDDFVLGLTDPVAYQAMHGQPSTLNGDIDMDGDQDFDDIDDFVGILIGGLLTSGYSASSAASVAFEDVSSNSEGIATGVVSTTHPAQPRLHLEWVQVGFTNDTLERHSASDVPRFTFEGHEGTQSAAFEIAAPLVPKPDGVFSKDLRRRMPQPSHSSRLSSGELELAQIWSTDQNWLLRDGWNRLD